MESITDDTRSLSLASGSDGASGSFRPEPVQTATRISPGQAIRLLEDKLAQGSDAGICLSTDEASELVRALRSSKDASDRLPGVEQDLMQAKEDLQELKELRFHAKYADYAGKVWNDICAASAGALPKMASGTWNRIRDPDSGNETMFIFNTSVAKIHPPISIETARFATQVYTRRCQLFHSRDVYRATKSTIGPRADEDLAALETHLPDSWKDHLGDCGQMINYVKDSFGSQVSQETGKCADGGNMSPSKLMLSESPEFFANLVENGMLPRQAIPFLIDHGVFVGQPEHQGPVSRPDRGRSLSPPFRNQGCKEPADADGSDIPRFMKRKVNGIPGDPANEDCAEVDKRQKLSAVKELL
ncbi:hypothetical protein FDENT_8236 [Fusarium denticulatum]|uniref:Uncharacterized protein n=1 Tax=Fusarium denticulatum TaxID=48507 RepID=A0A8H5U4U5_9HYPO|nr:hypothetical protein FDENT_8236 [Fusarium denticulatum]